MHAVEPGAAMADLIREKFDGTDLDVTVQTSDFESAEIEPGAYDLVFAPTSWHWLTPGLRWQRVADALLGTYCDHLTLAADVRERLLDRVAAVYRGDGGITQLPCTTHLLVARRA